MSDAHFGSSHPSRFGGCEADDTADLVRRRLPWLYAIWDFPDIAAAINEIERLSAIVTDLMDGMEAAWGLLANGAYWGHTDPARCEEWRQAMFRWRDERWHPALEAIRTEDNR